MSIAFDAIAEVAGNEFAADMDRKVHEDRGIEWATTDDFVAENNERWEEPEALAERVAPEMGPILSKHW